MEVLRRKNISGDKFSFPNMSVQSHEESEFEFGSVTPGSPSSPADHLFSNGKLLPHFFPIHPRNSTSYSRSMSRTSSISSKDSFLCSRSNSINSSSSCSSARTSISTDTSSSEKKIPSQGKVASKVQVTRERKQGEKPVLSNPQYGSSQRWQFIAPMPALKHQPSRRKKGETAVQEGSKRGRKKHAIEGKSKNSTKSKGFCRKIFMAFVSTCRECHAMNPSRRDGVLKENFKYFQ